MNATQQTIKEIGLFSKLANAWWDEAGPFKTLHAINPVRIDYILRHIQTHFRTKNNLKILDIGCGGGLVCEPFARLGHTVTGIDQSEEAIQVAQRHAIEQGLNINYQHQSIEDLQEVYDVITILEVLEHVDNPQHLLESAVAHLAQGGLIFFSTLNRTVFSYVAGILLAENILKWAPKGTHNWYQFLKPSEIILPLKNLGIQPLNLSGISWSMSDRQWKITSDLRGNYIGVGTFN
jgi:2-polyprenyl-6-hydroxyphenyl methylase / 3-demethylubiquinone-9 3-methyltransferase